jgi:hypothetical protein
MYIRSHDRLGQKELPLAYGASGLSEMEEARRALIKLHRSLPGHTII